MTMHVYCEYSRIRASNYGLVQAWVKQNEMVRSVTAIYLTKISSHARTSRELVNCSPARGNYISSLGRLPVTRKVILSQGGRHQIRLGPYTNRVYLYGAVAATGKSPGRPTYDPLSLASHSTFARTETRFGVWMPTLTTRRPECRNPIVSF